MIGNGLGVELEAVKIGFIKLYDMSISSKKESNRCLVQKYVKHLTLASFKRIKQLFVKILRGHSLRLGSLWEYHASRNSRVQ